MKKIMAIAAILCTSVALCDCKMPKRTKARATAAAKCMTDTKSCPNPSEVQRTEDVRSKCGKCSSCCGCKKSSCSSCCRPSCCKNCCRTPMSVTSPSEPTDPNRKCSKCNCGCSSCTCNKSAETDENTEVVEAKEDETKPETEEVATEEVATEEAERTPTPTPMPAPMPRS